MTERRVLDVTIQRKLSTQQLLHQIRQEYVQHESGRLGQLARLLDEALCSGDPLPEEWAAPPPSRRETIVHVVDGML
jgi:hypothetical protein